MANDKLNRIVVKGGSRRLGRLLTLLSYMLILASTVALIVLGQRRGINANLNVIYYVALVVNVIQIVYFLVCWLLESRGVFFKKRKTFEFIINIIWVLVILLELFFGSFTTIYSIRIDLLLITIAQLLVIIFIFKSTNAVENRVNVRYGKQEFTKRESKKSFNHVLTFLLLVVIQGSVLLIPKLPPKIDDIFSETRALEYIYDSVDIDGEIYEGYFVRSIYYGLNETVVIPATYNNVPVIGIGNNALTDSGTITEIVLGDIVDGELHSNLKIIHDNAINLNNIKTITLPSSLLKIEDNAINSNSLEEIIVESACKLKLNSFNTPKVNEIDLVSDEVINIDFGTKDYKFKVNEELYNAYRELNYDHRNSFGLDDLENKIIIDFETNCGVYLESKILTLEGGVAYLDLTQLKNSDGTASTSFIIDTTNYNENNYTKLESVTYENHVFRGWYRDSACKVECEFTEDNRTRFTESTTIYADWLKINKINLDWKDDYRPSDAPNYLNYVNSTKAEENIQFPALDIHGGDVSRVGYSNLKWEYNGKYYTDIKGLLEENPNIEDDATIHVAWELEKPTIDFTIKNGDDIKPDNSPVYTFDGVTKYYHANMNHNATDVTLTYVWKLDGVEIRRSQTTGFFSEEFRDCNQSGHYTLECIVDNGCGVFSSHSIDFNITINKRNLDNIFEAPDPVSEVYNGQAHNIKYDLTSDQKLYYSSTIMYDLDCDGVYESINGPVNHINDYYNALITIYRSDDDKDNYNVRTLYSKIYIEQKDVHANWVQTGTDFDGFNVTYANKKYELIPTIVGLVDADVDKGIKFDTITSGGNQIDVANYLTTISGIDFGSNPQNYKLSSLIEMSHTWSITQAKLVTSWISNSFTYNGSIQNAELYIYGLNPSDANDLCLGVFDSKFEHVGAYKASYKSEANALVIYFGVKDAGTYDVMLSGINNSNYEFTPTSKEINVQKATLSLSWSNPSKVYNANAAKSFLEINGFKANDAANVTLDNFGFISEDVTTHNLESSTNGTVTLSFSALNQGIYPMGITDIVNLNNYVLSNENKTNSMSITPLNLTGVWENINTTYNSQLQSTRFVIKNIPSNQLGSFDIDDFNIQIDGIDALSCVNSYVEGNNYVIEISKEAAQAYNLQINAAFRDSHLGNYTFASTSKVFTISPLPLEISWSNNQAATTLIYNATNYILTPHGDNVFSDDVVNFNVSNNDKVDAGSYIAYINSIDNSNYVLVESTKAYNWAIQPKKLSYSYTFNTNNAIYDGSYKKATILVSGIEVSDLLSNSDDIKALFGISDNGLNYVYNAQLINNTYSLEFNSIDAGDYIISINNITDSNYDITELEKDYEYSILPREILIEWNYTSPFVYNGLYQSVNAVVSNKVIREDTSVLDTVDLYFNGNTNANVGVYQAIVTDNTNNNYVLSSDLDYSLDWEVLKKDLSISWTAPSNYLYNDTEREVKLTISGFENSEEAQLSFNDFNYTSSHNLVSSNNYINNSINGTVELYVYYSSVGTYNTTFTYVNDNYNIPVMENTVTIDPVVLDLSWSNDVFVYNSLSQQNYISASNICGDDVNEFIYEIYKVESSANLTQISGAVDAGSYLVKCVGVTNSNYVLPEVGLENEFIINKKTITVSWSCVTSDSSYLGGSYTYNASQQGLNLTLSGYVNDEDANNTLYNVSSNSSVIGSRFIGYDSGSYYLSQRFTSNNVGSYNIELNNSQEEGNYIFVPESNAYVIEPLELSLTWKDYNTTYNNLEQSTYVSPNNLYSGDVVNFTYSGIGNSYNGVAISENTAKYAGVYQVTVTSVDNPNYKLPTSGLTNVFTINKKTLTSYWNNSEKTYNGEIQSLSLFLNGMYVEDYDEISLTDLTVNHNITGVTNPIRYINGAIYVDVLNAGSYTVSYIDFETANYTLSEFTKSFNVYQRKLDLTWNVGTFTYNGMYQSVSASATNVVLGDEVVLNYEDALKIDAGNYTASVVSLSGIDASNYVLSANTSKAWSINKLPINITWDYTSPFTYNGNQNTVSAVINNLCIREDTSVVDTVTLTYLNNSKVNAGTYYASVSGVSNSNYTYVSSDCSLQWDINKIKLTSTWVGDGNSTYDGTVKSEKLYIDGLLPEDLLTATYSSVASNKNCDIASEIIDNYLVITLSATNAGAYYYNLTSSNMNNYQIEPTTTEFTIAQKDLYVDYSENSNYIYDGTNKTLVAVIRGFVASDMSKYSSSSVSAESSFSFITNTINNTLELTFSSKNAGSYNCDVTKVLDNNYKLNATTDNYLTISKANLDYSWSATDTISTYNGEIQLVSLTISGFHNQYDALTVAAELGLEYNSMIYAYSTDSNSIYISYGLTDSGTYNLGVNEIENSNYVTKTSKATLEITPKTLNGSWSTLNTFVYDGNEHSVSAVINGICSSDLERFNHDSFTYASNGVTLTYDQATTTLTLKGTNAKTYLVNDIDLSYTVNNNYVLELSNVQMVIEKKELSINWSGMPISVYDGSTFTMEGVIFGIVSGDEANVSVSHFSFDSNATVSYNQGDRTLLVSAITPNDYYFNLTAFNNTNYSISNPSNWNVNFRIISQILESNWSAQSSFVYGDLNQVVLTIDGILAEDAEFVNSSYITFIDGNEPVITYNIDSVGDYQFIFTFNLTSIGTFNLGIEAMDSTIFGSYNFSKMSKTVTVLPKELTVVWPSEDEFIHNLDGNSITVKIQGIAQTDLSMFDESSFVFSGNHTDFTYSVDGGDVLLTFNDLDFGTHNFKLEANEYGYYYLLSSSYECEVLPYSLDYVYSTYPSTIYFTNKEATITLEINAVDSYYLDYITTNMSLSGNMDGSFVVNSSNIVWTFKAKNVGTHTAKIALPYGIEYKDSNVINISWSIYKSNNAVISLNNDVMTTINEIDFTVLSSGNEIKLEYGVDYSIHYYADAVSTTEIDSSELVRGNKYYVVITLDDSLTNSISLINGNVGFVTFE